MGSQWANWLAEDQPGTVHRQVMIACPAFILGTSAIPPFRLASLPGLGPLLMALQSTPDPRYVKEGETMSHHQIGTLIIGAGQAGLATAYQLGRLGRDCLVVDGNARVGDNWRCHYDSPRLYSPARFDGLPGMAFPGDPWHFPVKDEVADFLERYAVDLAPPVRPSRLGSRTSSHVRRAGSPPTLAPGR